MVGGSKLGTLHFCGTTDFAPGIWAGVELDLTEGKHDGTVEGVSYFLCKPDTGVFVQPNKISKVPVMTRYKTSEFHFLNPR
jgi:dynactin complex subunit